MTSQVNLPTIWGEIQVMSENNGPARGDKNLAIHNFMRINGIDSSRFENQEGLIWPGSAAAQRQQIAAMIQDVEAGMGTSGSTPTGQGSQRRHRVSATKTSSDSDDDLMDMDTDDDGGGGGGGGGGVGIPPVALTNMVNTNAFDPYQSRVEEAMAAIREIGRGQSFQEMQIHQLEEIITNVYEVFFGVNYATGQPTPFHIQHGAAPIAGMSLPEVVTQARTAQAAQLEQQRMQESVFGFFRTFLQPLIQRRNELDPQGNRMSDHAWSQRGADTGLSDPLSIIAQLLDALQNIHVAGALLVRSDPLFIANRSERAQEGHLRVRGFWGTTSYAIARAGYSVLRNVIGAISPGFAVQIDSIMPAAYRSGSLAIMNFEKALATFDHLYQNLPPWARLCWTLPFSTTSPNYRADLPRWQNKPGAQQAEQAVQTHNFQLLMMARGSITEHFDPATYMAALTTTAVPIHGSNPPRFQKVVNGPLLAYYYALHGGRMLYLRQGREWLSEAFLLNPARFIQEMSLLRDSMDSIRSQFPRQHGQERGPPVIAQGSQQQQDARMLMDHTRTEQERAAAEQRLQAYFRSLVGTGVIGTQHVEVPAYLCRRQEPPATCSQRLSNQAGRFAAAVSRHVQQYANQRHSSQQEAQPLPIEALTQGMDGKAHRDFNERRAEQNTREVGEKRAAVNTALAERSEAKSLLRGIRGVAESALASHNPEEPSPLMQLPSLQAVASHRGSLRLARIATALIGEPNGLLAILNSHVYLYTKDDRGSYMRGKVLKLFQIITNYFDYKPTNYAQLEQVLQTVGVALINNARNNKAVAVGSFALDVETVHNLALRILQNTYWNTLLGMSAHAITMAKRDINRHGMWLGGDDSFGKPPKDPKHQGGGRKRKKTRKHKKKKKKTRRHRHKRKKRTRKH